MDYQVFLVSRVRGKWSRRRGDTADATPEDRHKAAAVTVETGFQGGAEVMVVAVVIMVGVLMILVHTDSVYVKPIALGLTVGIATNAFLVRTTLIPALMAALGEKTWWSPAWLDRLLPVVDAEGEGLEQALEQGEVATGQSARPMTDSSDDEAEDTEDAADAEDRQAAVVS